MSDMLVHGAKVGSLRLVQWVGDDHVIDQAARVSFDATSDADRTDEQRAKLIKYLWTNGHHTPFEMVQTWWEVECPYFVARQWYRHRMGSFNEVSRRYVPQSDGVYTPRWRGKPKGSVKQGSGDLLPRVDRDKVDEAYKRLQAAYSEFLDVCDDVGVANELSRIGSLQAHMTRFLWKVDLRNLLHFITLRGDKHAQQEIAAYADYMAQVVAAECPMVAEAVVAAQDGKY